MRTDYEVLKFRVWSFVDRFEDTNGFGKGDVRAYLSAMTDLLVAERGLSYPEALSEALRRAEELYRVKGLQSVKEDATRVISQWRALDRYRLPRSALNCVPPVPSPTPRPKHGLTVVSLFTGAFGLDLGFELAGFDVVLALDISEDSYRNLKANRPKIPFLLGDIKRYTTWDILKEAGLAPGEVDVITGGPPCQPFSTAGKRQSLGDPRAAPLVDFVRVIKEARPKVFVMEEVPGILSARIRHVPIKERSRPLSPEEEPGSAWRVVWEILRDTGYRVSWSILNAVDYGAPQVRERVIVVGVRPDLRRDPVYPKVTRSRRPSLSGLLPWLTLLEAIGNVERHIYCATLPPKYKRFMEYVPPGGNWRQIPDQLRREAMNSALDASGGKMGFFRRLTWFEPSPTLVTSPAMKATMMVHPWEDRPLSVGEYLKIQGFPDDWVVVTSGVAAYRLFGEAVPVPLAYAIAEAVRDEILLPNRRVAAE